MSKAHSIAPFPADLDREAFAHWLTGFTDGEGSFFLRVVNQPGKLPQPYANFRIALRADDEPILQLIQSFFGCGVLNYNSNVRSKIKNAKPVVAYDVNRTEPLATIIVPHFERYPLRAKKQNDFLIWKEGVALLDTVQRRPAQFKFSRRADGRNSWGGQLPKWTDAEREHFHTLMTTLRQRRAYTEEPRPERPDTPPTTERTLFD